MRRVARPLGVAGAAVLAAVAVQATFDPFTQDIPLCPVHALTGLDCPGCGMTRAVHALLAGDPLLAVRCNVLLMVMIPIAAIVWVRWLGRSWRGDGAGRARGTSMPTPRLVLACVIVALVFAVLRNLPAFWFLAPPPGA